MKIAIDAMGGDIGLAVTIPGVVQALVSNDVIEQVFLFGHEGEINTCLHKYISAQSLSRLMARVRVIHSEYVVPMSAKPSDVLRQRHSSSMLLALKAVSDGSADACVSGGNTGALVGLARHTCGLFAGVKRLAICAQLPTLRSNTYLLDVGGNVDCSGEQLHQFARMGCALGHALDANAQPCVRALSIGVEAGKGNSAVNQAVQLCEDDSKIQFEGLIEGNHLLMGDCDVVFCDGFVGNVALKSCEGAASYIRSSVAELLTPQSLITDSGVTQLVDAIDPARFDGAVLLGLNQLVIKSHGASQSAGFAAAIQKAIDAYQGELVEKLARVLA